MTYIEKTKPFFGQGVGSLLETVALVGGWGCVYEQRASWSQIREQTLVSKNSSDDVMLSLVSVLCERAYSVGELFVNFLKLFGI